MTPTNDLLETISDECRAIEALAKMLRRVEADILEPLRRDRVTTGSIDLAFVETCEIIAKIGWGVVDDEMRRGVHI